MEKGDFIEIEPEGLPKIQLSLGTALIEAVFQAVSNASGKMFGFQAGAFAASEEEADPSQVAMAVAYASLCMEEPEMVTSSHKKMLRSAFSYEQIQDLNRLIQKMMQ